MIPGLDYHLSRKLREQGIHDRDQLRFWHESGAFLTVRGIGAMAIRDVRTALGVPKPTAADVHALHAEGHPASAVAFRLGLSQLQVTKVLAGAKRIPKRGRQAYVLPDGFVDRYHNGETTLELARAAGCSQSAMYGALLAAGTTMRPPGGHRAKLTRAQCALLEADLRAGVAKHAALARKYGISRERVRQIHATL